LHTRILNDTLSPYTTLFRSKTGVITDKIMYSSSKSDAVRPTVRYTVNDKEYVFTSLIGQNPKLRKGKKVGVYYNPENPNEAVIEDRKSTRLNSSHVSISYAV